MPSTTWRNRQREAERIRNILRPGAVVAAFDTETTGLGQKAKIIQFSGLKLLVGNDGKFSIIPGSDFDIYINPREQITEKITEITGITQDMLDSCQDESYWFVPIMNWLCQSNAWCAYNAPFDIRMIEQMCERLGYQRPGREVFDILQWAKDIVPADEVEDYKLATITEHYASADETFKFHSSIEDVKAMVTCMNCLMPEYFAKAEKPTVTAHLEKGSLFINPRRGSQKRIRLTLNFGAPGDIYYDIIGKRWSCKTTSSAKRLFSTVDMADLERQFLEKYAYPFGLATVDEVAKSWIKFRDSQRKR